MGTHKLTRCLSLFYILHCGGRYSVAQLSEEIGVSPRTVYRYLRQLEEAGVPVRYDEEKSSHVIVHNFNLRTLNFSDEELLGLLLAAHSSIFSWDKSFRCSIKQAIGKLLMRSPPQTQVEISNLLNGCIVEPPELPKSNDHDEMRYTILLGIRLQRRIRIRYRSMNETEQIIQTSVAPYRVIASSTGWSLVGRSSWHRQILFFKLEDIVQVKLTEDSFTVPKVYRGWPRLHANRNAEWQKRHHLGSHRLEASLPR
jgi:predicted DNA-binding transcriptional regulator YafY